MYEQVALSLLQYAVYTYTYCPLCPLGVQSSENRKMRGRKWRKVHRYVKNSALPDDRARETLRQCRGVTFDWQSACSVLEVRTNSLMPNTMDGSTLLTAPAAPHSDMTLNSSVSRRTRRWNQKPLQLLASKILQRALLLFDCVHKSHTSHRCWLGTGTTNC